MQSTTQDDFRHAVLLALFLVGALAAMWLLLGWVMS